MKINKLFLVALTIAFSLSGCFTSNDSTTNDNNSNSSGSNNNDATNSNSTEVYPKQIKKTGQTQSYDDSGNEIVDGSIKDDGYYQKGRALNYQRDDASNIVNDLTDNLVWADDSDVNTQEFSYNNADNYCTNLTLGNNSNWRIPKLKELMALVDRSKRAPALDTAFENTAYGVDDIGYWSATAFGFGWQMWVNFFSGNDHWFETSSNRHYVRCVSGNSSQWAAANFTRDSSDTVTDNNSHLQWQDSQSSSRLTMTWEAAINYCESLVLNSKSDWRLPNINELYSITDHYQGTPTIDATFQNTAEAFYWSSTTYAGSGSHAWSVSFEYGSNNYSPKSKAQHVRCVRGGE